MKKFLSILMAFLMTLTIVMAFAGCSSTDTEDTSDTSDTADTSEDTSTEDSDLAYILDKGTLAVGITEYEPMNYKEDGSDEWTGFDTEYAQAVAEKLGVEVEFVVIDWDNKFLELDSQSINCIWNGMTITDEVTSNADVTDVYVKNAQAVVTTAEIQESYTTIAEMTDITFTAEAGSAGEAAIEEAGFACTSVSDQATALMEVASGSSDACVINITMVNVMTGEGTNYEDLVQAEELEAEEYDIACRKGSDLVAEINTITDELIEDGTMDFLAEKYSFTLIK
ncbi:MAG: transporter substrate-binding domain-containing protein [Clostridiales bacterium]|nr:transporter substrate-binding domain-containing protein [Clostridiales bacterium]